MNSSPSHAPYRLAWVILALIGALLACTASQGGSRNNDTGSSPANGGGQPQPGGAPSVQIITPPSGEQVPANQRVDITVETTSTATNFLLNVGGRVVSTKAMPPGQSGPTQAILSWLPDHQGTYNLEVIAFNGTQASAPASLLLVVSGTASSSGSSGSGCTGRVLVSQLNFRSGPGTNTSQLGQFDVGETVTVTGRNTDTSWVQVQRYNAQTVWTINNPQWFQMEGQCGASLPVVG